MSSWRSGTVRGRNLRRSVVIFFLRSRPPFTGVLLGPRPESAPRSAFWAILGTCLGVPQRVLFECFLAIFGPKNAKKQSKKLFGALRGRSLRCPKLPKKHSGGHFQARALKALLQMAAGITIFFSLTEAPLPDPTPTPPNTPKRTRNGPETDPKHLPK